jgi:hypothetical protein
MQAIAESLVVHLSHLLDARCLDVRGTNTPPGAGASRWQIVSAD